MSEVFEALSDEALFICRLFMCLLIVLHFYFRNVPIQICTKNMLHHMQIVLLLLLLAPDAVSPPSAVSYPSALDVTWEPPVR